MGPMAVRFCCIVHLLGICLLFAAPITGHAEPPSFQSLMDPAVFPEPQCGMVVEAAGVVDECLKVRTTGALFSLDLNSGKGIFHQRIGGDRPVAELAFSGGMGGVGEVTHLSPGLAFAQVSGPRVDIRANGDSLFMFHARAPLTIQVTRRIPIGFESSFETNHILLDELGGFGLYCSERGLDDHYAPYGDTTATYVLPAGAVLWVGVCPPKPYDWDRSFTDNVVWHWSRERGYPTDEEIARWATAGNIALLQSEVMLWKDWNLDFEPRHGREDFARVRDAIHAAGMRFMVYTSPAYFFPGTKYEPEAFNSFENFKNWPPLNREGDNFEAFMAAITKVMTELKPDGLYFDGQYIDHPDRLYALARQTRQLLGEDGILEWHSTAALGLDLCFLPQADAYLDFILRGESQDDAYGRFDYLRYFVSGYNTSNSIGVLCNNGPLPTPELVQRLLDANCRLHTLVRWLDAPGLVEMLDAEYRQKLTPDLRGRVEQGALQRQLDLPTRTEKLAYEDRALGAPPAYTRSVLTQAFEAVPDWEQVVSPLDKDPFSRGQEGLLIRAKAHTHAYLKHAVGQPVTAVAAKIRQGTDGGMSWGPSVFLRWPGGKFLRLGLRSDGRVQLVLNEREHLLGRQDPDSWVWVRARWLDALGVVEYSHDGANYERLHTFTHHGEFLAPVTEILVGKVPYSGDPIDHEDPGPEGECEIAEVVVY